MGKNQVNVEVSPGIHFRGTPDDVSRLLTVGAGACADDHAGQNSYDSGAVATRPSGAYMFDEQPEEMPSAVEKAMRKYDALR
jgi:hypothetical protein